MARSKEKEKMRRLRQRRNRRGLCIGQSDQQNSRATRATMIRRQRRSIGKRPKVSAASPTSLASMFFTAENALASRLIEAIPTSMLVFGNTTSTRSDTGNQSRFEGDRDEPQLITQVVPIRQRNTEQSCRNKAIMLADRIVQLRSLDPTTKEKPPRRKIVRFFPTHRQISSSALPGNKRIEEINDAATQNLGEYSPLYVVNPHSLGKGSRSTCATVRARTTTKSFSASLPNSCRSAPPREGGEDPSN